MILAKNNNIDNQLVMTDAELKLVTDSVNSAVAPLVERINLLEKKPDSKTEKELTPEEKVQAQAKLERERLSGAVQSWIKDKKENHTREGRDLGVKTHQNSN